MGPYMIAGLANPATGIVAFGCAVTGGTAAALPWSFTIIIAKGPIIAASPFTAAMMLLSAKLGGPDSSGSSVAAGATVAVGVTTGVTVVPSPSTVTLVAPPTT